MYASIYTYIYMYTSSVGGWEFSCWDYWKMGDWRLEFLRHWEGLSLLSRSSTISTLAFFCIWSSWGNVLYCANILKLSIFKLSLQLRLKPQMAERLAHPTTHVRPRHDRRGSHPSLVTLIFRKLGLSQQIWRWVMWVYQWFSHHMGIDRVIFIPSPMRKKGGYPPNVEVFPLFPVKQAKKHIVIAHALAHSHPNPYPLPTFISSYFYGSLHVETPYHPLSSHIGHGKTWIFSIQFWPFGMLWLLWVMIDLKKNMMFSNHMANFLGLLEPYSWRIPLFEVCRFQSHD